MWLAYTLLFATSDTYRIPGLLVEKWLCGYSIVRDSSQHLKQSFGTKDSQVQVKANIILYSSHCIFPHSPGVCKAPLPPKKDGISYPRVSIFTLLMAIF